VKARSPARSPSADSADEHGDFQVRQEDVHMEKDFSFKDGIYLVKDQNEFDLHNNFDFQEVVYSVSQRRVTLGWSRSKGEWVSAHAPTFIRIEFSEVTEYRFFPRDSELPFTEDDCLSVAGYWTDGDWCDGVFMTDETPEKNWLTAFGFMSGAIIAVQAERAKAVLEP